MSSRRGADWLCLNVRRDMGTMLSRKADYNLFKENPLSNRNAGGVEVHICKQWVGILLWRFKYPLFDGNR